MVMEHYTHNSYNRKASIQASNEFITDTLLVLISMYILRVLSQDQICDHKYPPVLIVLL